MLTEDLLMIVGYIVQNQIDLLLDSVNKLNLDQTLFTCCLIIFFSFIRDFIYVLWRFYQKSFFLIVFVYHHQILVPMLLELVDA